MREKINPSEEAVIGPTQSVTCLLILFTFWLESHIITCQTDGSNKSDKQANKQLTLFKLPLHAFHLWLVATYAVQTLRIQAWGKEKRSREKGEAVGGHSGKQAKHKQFISPVANRHDNIDAGSL